MIMAFLRFSVGRHGFPCFVTGDGGGAHAAAFPVRATTRSVRTGVTLVAPDELARQVLANRFHVECLALAFADREAEQVALIGSRAEVGERLLERLFLRLEVGNARLQVPRSSMILVRFEVMGVLR